MERYTNFLISPPIMKQEAYRIQPKGYFDATQANGFRAQIREAIHAKANTVILDCQDVLCIDSSGLGELILAYKSLRQVQSKFILCAINEQIETLLSMTGMNQIFEVQQEQSS